MFLRCFVWFIIIFLDRKFLRLTSCDSWHQNSQLHSYQVSTWYLKECINEYDYGRISVFIWVYDLESLGLLVMLLCDDMMMNESLSPLITPVILCQSDSVLCLNEQKCMSFLSYMLIRITSNGAFEGARLLCDDYRGKVWKILLNCRSTARLESGLYQSYW